MEMGGPVRSVIKWIFDPSLPRSTGFGPVKPPFQGPHVHRVDRAPRPVQGATSAELVQDQAVELAPHSGSAPLSEPPVSSRPGRPEDRGQLPPPAARRGHEHDGRKRSVITDTLGLLLLLVVVMLVTATGVRDFVAGTQLLDQGAADHPAIRKDWAGGGCRTHFTGHAAPSAPT